MLCYIAKHKSSYLNSAKYVDYGRTAVVAAAGSRVRTGAVRTAFNALTAATAEA